MAERIDADLCIIGAGSAGLSVAAGAVQMGARTVLIERGLMGGDCLNFGCVPSKSLLAAAKAATAWRAAAPFGIEANPPRIDWIGVRAHVAAVIASIAPHDSVERFEGLGVRVIHSEARFTGPDELVAGGASVHARRFVIATGSEPLVPPIPGLEGVPFLTNETIFALDTLPLHLLVLGGGPVGCELAQAFRRLGSEVTLVEMVRLLPKDDEEAASLVRASLLADGVSLIEGGRAIRAEMAEDEIMLAVARDGSEERVFGSHLLVAVGRKPVLEGLGLEAAGVAADKTGIRVDGRLRTSNRRIYAAGDVTGGPQFTHMASHHASIVIRNALFRMPATVERRAVPWVTYTDPELAQVGLTEASARSQAKRFTCLRSGYDESDRARAERAGQGFVKVLASPRGTVLGATIVGRGAGELILPWVLAMQNGLGLKSMAQMLAPYPTFGEIGKRAAGSFFAPRLFSPGTRRLVRLLQRLP
ncbi:MAG TPA: FAD-dependent oxidoreductase [Alphaproteobacteria bacterium]|nr:FAD-dependent oxidoreductase [Alphaproteobacteria bacterium]